jgi:hypothetical protein
MPRIAGVVIDSLMKELNKSSFYNRYNEYNLKNGDLSYMSGLTEVDNAIF